MAARFGAWTAAAVAACLVLAGCAAGALGTPTPAGSAAQSHGPQGSGAPSGSGGSTDGAPASGGVPPSPSESASAGVVDESAGRYDDGLPKVVDGQQVLRDGDAIDHAKSAGGSQSFYIGGWLTPVQGLPAGTATPVPCPTGGCQPTIQLADKAGTVDNPLNKAVDFHQLAGAALATGPVVLQVHSNDPNAVCSQQACDSTMVVDGVIWSR